MGRGSVVGCEVAKTMREPKAAMKSRKDTQSSRWIKASKTEKVPESE